MVYVYATDDAAAFSKLLDLLIHHGAVVQQQQQPSALCGVWEALERYMVVELDHLRYCTPLSSLKEAVYIFLALEYAYLTSRSGAASSSPATSPAGNESSSSIDEFLNHALATCWPPSPSQDAYPGLAAYAAHQLLRSASPAFTVQKDAVEFFCGREAAAAAAAPNKEGGGSAAGDPIASQLLSDAHRVKTSSGSSLTPSSLFQLLHIDPRRRDEETQDAIATPSPHGRRTAAAGQVERIHLLIAILGEVRSQHTTFSELLNEAAAAGTCIDRTRKAANPYALSKVFSPHDYVALVPVTFVQEILVPLQAAHAATAICSSSSSTSQQHDGSVGLRAKDPLKFIHRCNVWASSCCHPHSKSGRGGIRVLIAPARSIPPPSSSSTAGSAAISASNAKERDAILERLERIRHAVAERDYRTLTCSNSNNKRPGIQQMQQQPSGDTMSSVMGDLSIGVDVLVMLFAGAAAGYYLGVLRGASEAVCLLYLLVGMTVMLIVDGGLLIIRLYHEDGESIKKLKRTRRWMASLPSSSSSSSMLPKQGGSTAAAAASQPSRLRRVGSPTAEKERMTAEEQRKKDD